jgi:DNA-directed RNA polymerase specialized sigma24 family protein
MIETPSPVRPDDDMMVLVRRAQEGCAESARIVYERFRQPLLGVIRKVIPQPLRRLEDSDDFLQSTFTQIFTKHFSDEVLRGPETLWPYLKRIAENQVRDARRKFLLSQRRQLNLDVPLEEDSLQSREISPCEALILKELVEERLHDLIGQFPALLQEIVLLVLRGDNGHEIAGQLGMESKRVYRAIAWLERKVMEG